MAKVTGAFGGFGTRQQIGKAYVFFIWKGINAIRTWVIPNNPNTGQQQAQRNNFKALIARWHSANMNADDKTAWERAAGQVRFKPQSGFNRFLGVLRAIFFALGANEYVELYTLLADAHAAFSCQFTASAPVGGDTFNLNYGTSPSSMPYNTTGAYAFGVWTLGPFDTGFAAGVKLYFKVNWTEVGGVTKGATGIYTETLS